MNFTDVYVEQMFRKYADFEGRTNLSDYTTVFWCNVIINILLFVLGFTIESNIISNIVGVIMIIPWIAINVRRMHDIGKSGWFILLFLIPIIGLFVWIIYAFRKGNE